MLEAPIGGDTDSPACGWANIVDALLPTMELLGIASRADVDIHTLTQRLDAEEVSAEAGMVIVPPMVGAWARRAQDD